MQNGNDTERREKLNTLPIGAENEREAELREKFASELFAARERADARIRELNYAKSYKNKLERERSAAEKRKLQEKRLAKEAEKEAAAEERRALLRGELDEIEERRQRGLDFISRLKKEQKPEEEQKPENAPESDEPKLCEAEAAEEEKKAEAAPKSVGVSKNTRKIDAESKVIFTKSSRYKIKKPAGINIKFAPLVAHAGFVYPTHPHFVQYPTFPSGDFKGASGFYHGFVNVPSYRFEGERVAANPRGFSARQGENYKGGYNAYPSYEENYGYGEKAFDSRRGATGGAFLGGALFGAALARGKDTYSYAANGSSRNVREPQTLDYNAPLEYDRFSDTEHIAHGYEPYTDVDHAPQNYDGFSDAEYIAHGYEPYTDVDHAPQNYDGFSDAEHIAHGYEPYTDVDHAPQNYESFSDAEHITHGYETYTDADHAPQNYEGFSDAEHIAHGYEPYTDVDHAPQNYDGFSDAEHIAHGYDPYTDVDHAPQNYESFSDAEHIAHGYEPYTDADHAPQNYEGFSDAEHITHGYEPYTDVDHAPQNYESFSDAEHIAQGYEPYTDVDHAPQNYEGFSDAEHIAHGYEPYTDVDHAPQNYDGFSDAEHIAHGYEPYTDADHAPQNYDGFSDAEHIAHGYEAYTDVDHADVRFDTFTDYEGDFGAYRQEDENYAPISDSYEDERAIAAYEAMRMRRERGEGRYSGYNANAELDGFSTPVGEDFAQIYPVSYDFEHYGERQILKYLKESDKRVKEYERAILKKEKTMRKLSGEDKNRALLDTVNLNKHVVDLRAMALYAVAVSGETKQKKYRKRLFTDAINEYNSALSDYEGRTGESFKKANLSLVAEVASGKSYTPLPIIQYSDERALNLPAFEDEVTLEDFSSVSRKERNREKLRFLREARREEKRIARFAKGKSAETLGSGVKISDFREKIERDLTLLKTRSEALTIDALSRLDYLDYSFSVNYKDKKRERRELKEKIRKLKRMRGRALKYERRDSERYYSQLLVTADSLGITKRRTADKLDSLNMRLDALLSERERINEQLIKLYSGDIRGDGDRKINQKLRKIKRRVAKRTSKKFRRQMRVLEKRVPLDIKEKLAKSANKIIDAEILIATLKFKIRKNKPRGEVRRDMKAKIRENQGAIKYYLADYRRFLKRARAYAERSFGVKIQVVWILAVLAVLITLTVLYLRFEEPVNAFFYRIYKYLKSIL